MENFEDKKKQLILLKKKTNRRTLIVLLITIITIVILVKTIINYTVKNPNVNASLIILLMIISFFAICVIAIIINNNINKKDYAQYSRLYKDMHKSYKNYVLSCFEKKFENVIYEQDKGISVDEIYDKKLISTGDLFNSNDFLKASYKDVQFRFSDVHTQEKVEKKDKDGKVHTYYETLFRGQWYEFDFNKPFKSNVRIYESYSNSLKNNKSNRILMEDVEFNNKFFIQADSELDAFYILTPNIIEKIKELSLKLSGNINLGFINNKLFISVYSGKDMFELNLFAKFNLDEEINKINNDIKVICDFIEILNLDNDLFRREV